MGQALTVSSYPPISASTSVNVVSPRGVISKITRRTMYETVVPTEMRLRFGPYGGGVLDRDQVRHEAWVWGETRWIQNSVR